MTISIKDNLIECEGEPRPLLRSKESYEAAVENKTLVNVADADRLKNLKAERPVGLESPLEFECALKGELTVDRWKISPSKN